MRFARHAKSGFDGNAVGLMFNRRLLTRCHCRQIMSLPFSSAYPLKRARAHEVCGEGGLVFAAITAGQASGPVVWVSERWRPVVNPEGLAPYCDPGKLLVTRADTPLNVLASAETALRSGAAGPRHCRNHRPDRTDGGPQAATRRRDRRHDGASSGAGRRWQQRGGDQMALQRPARVRHAWPGHVSVQPALGKTTTTRLPGYGRL